MVLKQMGVSIDEKIQKEFKKKVKEKHNRTSGVYAREIEKALKFYMECGMPEGGADVETVIEKLQSSEKKKPAHTHNTNTSMNYHQSSKKELLIQFRDQFKHQEHIPRRQLEGFIMEAMDVTDKRTIEGYAQYLESKGCVSLEGTQVIDRNVYTNLTIERGMYG